MRPAVIGTGILLSRAGFAPGNHPDGWIAESAFENSAARAPQSGFRHGQHHQAPRVAVAVVPTDPRAARAISP